MSGPSGEEVPARSVRRLAPRDGGRGREVRGRWSVLRFFSWRYGTFYRRGRHWYTPLTWHIWSTRNLLLGVWAYRDDDEDWNVEVGLGPLLHLHLVVADWPRVVADSASDEALPVAGMAFASTTGGIELRDFGLNLCACVCRVNHPGPSICTHTGTVGAAADSILLLCEPCAAALTEGES